MVLSRQFSLVTEENHENVVLNITSKQENSINIWEMSVMLSNFKVLL
jgi:hypothetical protein